MINVSRTCVRCHAWRCEDSSVRFIMRISQVIVTVFEESSFIKRAIHLPAVKNKTGTVIYCRLQRPDHSALFMKIKVFVQTAQRNHSHRRSVFQKRRETRANGLHYIIVMYFTCDVWYWVFFSVTKEHKKCLPGGVESSSTCESRWRRGVPAVRCAPVKLSAARVSDWHRSTR